MFHTALTVLKIEKVAFCKGNENESHPPKLDEGFAVEWKLLARTH